MSSITPVSVDTVLAQMRTILAEGRVEMPALDQAKGVDGVKPTQGFGALLTESLDKVNAAQKNAGQLQDRFLQGDDKVSLAEVMIAGQKSEISFQSLLQVRNRVVNAYEEIMRIPI
ncbi:MAG: flagellar hook-basal body complex protein FliE [Immundisolibacteraceae bacterium]|nr:flagellar hook-basal body complex protein FliE [Immundisolibacteraceae bacterium]